MSTHGLEKFHMAWNVSRWNGMSTNIWPWKFPDGLESFQMAWKVSRWSGKFSVGLDSFQVVWTASRWPGKFPDGLVSFQMVWKPSMFIKTFQVYKNFPGSIATLLPWFFRLWFTWSHGLRACILLNYLAIGSLSSYSVWSQFNGSFCAIIENRLDVFYDYINLLLNYLVSCFTSCNSPGI